MIATVYSGFRNVKLCGIQVRETLTWTIVRIYKHTTCTRGIAWYPKEDVALVVGSGNGEVNKLRMDLTGVGGQLRMTV